MYVAVKSENVMLALYVDIYKSRPSLKLKILMESEVF